MAQDNGLQYVFMSAAGAEWEGGDPPLRGVRVLTLAVNLPGPAAASRLCAMGVSVIKVEPPGGDPLALRCPGYYEDLGRIFETKTAEQWEEWAADRDLPLAAVRDVEHNAVDETASQRRRTSTRGEDK